MYRHTQTGWPIIAVMIPIIVMLVLTNKFLIVMAVALLALLLVFASLTVTADDNMLRFRFGIGLIGKTIPYAQIADLKAVRNKWYYGWGIRWFGRGWLYNVSGLDAIELSLKSGKVLRIGTDEPDELASFLHRRIAV